MVPKGEQSTPVRKAIGLPELEDGGKLYPAGFGESGIPLDEKEPRLPRIEDYSGEAELPTDGLIVSPAWMAEAVLDGRKTLIVKTRPFEIAGKRYLLISERKALGVVTLGKLRDVDLDELKRTIDQHLISEDLRSEWAKAQKGWKKGPFYAWPVKMESKFDAPAETNIGPGPQVLARDVELKSVEKQIHTDPTHLFFCARLPDEIRKKLMELSGELLKGVDFAEADDADHITVLYVPSKGEYSESDKEDALSAVQKVLDKAKPIDAKFQGWGFFDGASKDGEAATALVALVDAPGLAELHTEIKAVLSKAGFTEIEDQTHGFVPHATLAYLPVGARIDKLPVLDAAFKIEKIELVHSDINELGLRGTEKRVAKPFRSPGGKDPWADDLLKRVPKHKVYVEPYAGGATLFWAKEPSEQEVLCDIDPEIIAVYRFLKTGSDADFKWIRQQEWRGSPERFARLLELKPNSLRARAFRHKYLNLHSQRGRATEFSGAQTVTGKRFLDNLEKFRERLSNTKIVEGDALKLIKKLDSTATFFYLDPPWKAESKTDHWKNFDADKFLDAVKKLKGRVLLSYQGNLDLGSGWTKRKLTRTTPGFGGLESTQILYQNYTVQEAKKIRDPKTYDASKVSDAVLRDDHRLTLAYYANWKKDPKGFKYDLETIELLLRKILKEAVRRGPEVVRFNPKGMKPSVREFWERVAREVKLPEVMLKRVELAPDLDAGEMTTADLTEAHWRLHKLWRGPAEDRRRAGFSVEDVSNLHALITDELFERKVLHPPPPGDGLDDVSEDFERHEEKQPDYDVPPWEKVSKRDYAFIHSSGVKRGPEIKLDDVLPYFKTFKLRQPYVYLVGGLANRGATEGDIDILVKDTEELPEDFKHVVHFRLGRALPPELSERLEIHFDNFHGPFTNNVPLYDLTFERVNPQNEVKEMAAADLPPNVVTSVDDLRAFLKRRGVGRKGD